MNCVLIMPLLVLRVLKLKKDNYFLLDFCLILPPKNRGFKTLLHSMGRLIVYFYTTTSPSMILFEDLSITVCCCRVV